MLKQAEQCLLPLNRVIRGQARTGKETQGDSQTAPLGGVLSSHPVRKQVRTKIKERNSNEAFRM